MEGDDEDSFSFITLSAATRNVTRYLRLDEKKEDSADNSGSSDNDQKRVLEHLEFVKRRLRDFERFENRAHGKRK